MNTSTDTDRSVAQPATAAHLVHLYQDDSAFLGIVTRFATTALQQEQALIVIATPAHRTALRDRLSAGEMEATEQLLLLDAHECLAKFLVDGMPDQQRFAATIGPVIQHAAARWGRVAAFGEMVDVLWQEGRAEAAIRLEELWNDLIGEHGVTLLCGYRIDLLNDDWEHVRHIYHTHSHVEPVDDGERFHQAVWRAMDEVLGSASAAHMRQLIAGTRGPVTSPASTVLCWLREKMPVTAETLLGRIRHYYSTPDRRA